MNSMTAVRTTSPTTRTRLGRLAAAAALAGCTTMVGCQGAGEGALSGGALGALAGFGLGSLSGNAGKGAAAGAIIGAVGGAILGDQNERHERRY